MKNKIEMVDLIKWYPENINNIDINELDGNDWTEILLFQPQLIHMCPLEKLSGANWVDLLIYRPRLGRRYLKNYNIFSGKDWAFLLAKTTITDKKKGVIESEFAEFCDWNLLDGRDWAELLSEQPCYADRCDMTKLSESDWAYLLKNKPQFKRLRN